MKQLTLILSLVSIIPASALTVESMPGELAHIIGEDFSDKELVIKGALDIRDFDILRELSGVKTLDLSGAAIKGHSATTPIFPGISWAAPDALPAYALFQTDFATVKLPATLTSIGEGAFAGSQVKSITIPEGVTSIADYAFYGCKSLSEVALPSGLTTLGRYTFSGCNELNKVNIQDTKVNVIPEKCFAQTPSLQQLDTKGIREVGQEAFSGSGITHLMLPGARSLAAYALYGMSDLEMVTLSQDARINKGLLMNATSLQQITGIPDIVPDLFAANCTSFSPLPATEAATSIGKFAFANCAADRFLLGKNITSIDGNAFAGCTTLKSIDATRLAGYTPAVDTLAFKGIEVGKVYLIVDENATDIWKYHPVWGEFRIVNPGYREEEEEGVGTVDIRSSITISVDEVNIVATSDADGMEMHIYDTGGHRILSVSAAGNSISAPLESLPQGVLLINAISSSGDKKMMKFMN